MSNQDLDDRTTDAFGEPKKNFKFPKWAVVAITVICVLIIAALIIPKFFDQSKYKGQIIQKITDATGYSVTWQDDISISLLPLPHVTIYKASISNGPQKIASVDEASVSIALAPLFQKRFEIKSVKLVKPVIDLVVDGTGRQTWMTDKLKDSKEKSAHGEGKNTKKDHGQSLSIESLHIEDGSVLYRNEGKKSEQVVTNLNADISADTLSGPFDVDGSLTYTDYDIKAKADIGALGDNKTPLKVHVSLPKNNIDADLDGVFASGDKSVSGKLSLSASSIEDTLAAITKKKTELPKELRGKFDLTGNINYNSNAASIKDMSLTLGDLKYSGEIRAANLDTQPVVNLDLKSASKIENASSVPVQILSALQVKGGGSYADNVLTLAPTAISFDGQTVNISGTYKSNIKGGRPVVDLTLHSDALDLDDLQQQTGKVKDKKSVTAANGDKKESQKQQGVELPFDGNLRGTVGKLTASGKNYMNIKLDIANAGPNLKINQFAANTVADTSLAVSGQIANLPELSGLNLSIIASTDNLESLLKAYNVPPINFAGQSIGSSSMNGKFTGSLDTLNFDATANALQFAAKGTGQVQSPLAQPVIKSLNLNVKHPSLQSAVRIFSPGFEAPGSLNGPLDIGANITLNDKQYDLSDIRGNLGLTTVGGSLKLKLDAKPDISGNLNFGKLVFAAAVPDNDSSPSGSGGRSPAKNSDSRWSREAIETAWMNKANANLQIKVSTLQSGLWLLNNANLDFKLNNGMLDVSDLSAGLFGGSVTINGSMKSEGDKAPIFMDWTAKAKNLNGQNLFSALRNKNSDTLTGTIESFNASIKAQGISPAALVQNLSGNGDAKANNIVIKGIDAAKLAEAASGSFKPLERAGTLFSSVQNGQTSFTDFNMGFEIVNGIVNFTTLKFDGPQATLISTGNVNLPRWTVDLKNTMTVKNTDVPPFEFTVAGPLDNPAQTGGGVIENYLKQRLGAKIQDKYGDKINEKLNKLGLPAGLADGLLGGKTQAPAETTPAIPSATPEIQTLAPTENPDATAAPTEEIKPTKKTQEEKKQEQIQEGVKALQGLLGQ